MQLDVLHDLQRKLRGAKIGWTPITLAQGLTDLGLARREPSGWRITGAGEAILAGMEPHLDESTFTVLPFSPRANRTSL